MATICYAKPTNIEISIVLLCCSHTVWSFAFGFLVKLHNTHHIIVAVLSWQVERNLSFVWLAVDRRTRFQQHLHGLCLPLPGCIVQRPHTCTPTVHKHRTCPSHGKLWYIILLTEQYVYVAHGRLAVVSVCFCTRVHVWPSPFWSLMSTAACDSSSREMSSRFPLRAAWCSGENL